LAKQIPYNPIELMYSLLYKFCLAVPRSYYSQLFKISHSLVFI